MPSSPRFGALPLPAPAPGAGETAGDPGLDVVLSFCMAVLLADVNAAYKAVAPETGNVVKNVFSHNPADGVFEQKQLPALYAWRTTGDSERLADDIELDSSVISMLWVFVPAKQDNQRVRSPLINAVAKALKAALLTGRHPAWQQTGDPEPQAAWNGSFLWEWAGWWSLDKVSTKPASLDVDFDGEKARFPALQIDLTVHERAVRGLPSAPAKVQGAVSVPDGAGGQHTVSQFRLPEDP
jgi:hypothetical protein